MFLFSHCSSWVLVKAPYILRFIPLIYKIKKDHGSSSPCLQQVYRCLFSVWPYRSYSSYKRLSQCLKLRAGQVQVWLVPWGRKHTLLTIRSWGYIPFILCCTECCLKQHFYLNQLCSGDQEVWPSITQNTNLLSPNTHTNILNFLTF